ncbi:hypothetical protein MLD38_007957 [Melastoma candidum]|uniref:Uncharacterized protein n=1 Tax=Melastoma candidum TaxID=119954 RepID=A0ACB9RUP0_9MYRT|nr:hypothetical protein MLD38_007957 [Melastoma candidum]
MEFKMYGDAEIATELRLGLPGAFQAHDAKQEKKRPFWEIDGKSNKGSKSGAPAKNQVVGWPPVCSYRKRAIGVTDADGTSLSSKAYVKVSMDGAIYLRKTELGEHGGYGDLTQALEKLFGCTGIGTEASKEKSSEYMLIYEDKDGDWMHVGDVPWKMFRGTCKRLRITKRSKVKDMNLPSPPCQQVSLDDTPIKTETETS